MVWSIVRPIAAFSLTVIFLLSTLPTGSAETEPQVFFSEGFDVLEDWTFSGHSETSWGLTTDRSHRGSALYWGDDKGTSDPGDNEIPSCFSCLATARSPVFTIPSDTPAFLYLWVYADVDGFDESGLTLHAHPSEGQGESIEAIPLIKGGLLKYDLGAYAGDQIALSFALYQDWAIPWYEGLYLDSVLVTDLDVVVSHLLHLESDGPSADVAFRVPEGGTQGTLIVAQEGWARGHAAGQFDLVLKDGEPRFAGAFHGKSLAAGNIDLDLLGNEVIQINDTSNGRIGLGSRMSLSLSGLSPGYWELAAGLVGMETDHRSTEVILYVEGALDEVQVSVGGEELAFAFGRDFDSSTFFIGASDVPVLMIGGEITREAAGGAFGLISMYGEVASYHTTLPQNTTSAFDFHLAREPGTWGLHVDAWAGGSDWPVFELVAFAPRPQAMDLPPTEADALPDVGEAEPVDPIPEPEPWPEGYNMTANGVGLISCGVAAGPVQSADLCDPLDPNSVARFEFPLDNGTTSIDLQVTTEAGVLSDARVCATVLRPIEVDQVVCSDEGRLTVWQAAEGEAMTRGDETIKIDVRIAPGEGFLYQQKVHVDLETAHWGGA